jgi:hypothetical protein
MTTCDEILMAPKLWVAQMAHLDSGCNVVAL